MFLNNLFAQLLNDFVPFFPDELLLVDPNFRLLYFFHFLDLLLLDKEDLLLNMQLLG